MWCVAALPVGHQIDLVRGSPTRYPCSTTCRGSLIVTHIATWSPSVDPDLGKLAEAKSRIALRPAAVLLQRLRQVPVIDGHHRLDPGLPETLDQPSVVVEAAWLPPRRPSAAPSATRPRTDRPRHRGRRATARRHPTGCSTHAKSPVSPRRSSLACARRCPRSIGHGRRPLPPLRSVRGCPGSKDETLWKPVLSQAIAALVDGTHDALAASSEPTLFHTAGRAFVAATCL